MLVCGLVDLLLIFCGFMQKIMCSEGMTSKKPRLRVAVSVTESKRIVLTVHAGGALGCRLAS